jgi:hypothetical protein
MSRSYKKTPICKDGYGSKNLKWYKRSANKKVRRHTEIHSGKSYRKVYETWTFRDYIFRKTLKEHIIELQREIDICLKLYGNINNLSNYYKKEYNNGYFRMWKKFYYWK